MARKRYGSDRKSCAYCGKMFFSRQQSIYCSGACKNGAYKKRLTAKDTICWGCRHATNAYNRCSWSARGEPVPGWSAKATRLKVAKGSTVSSYMVQSCPLFEEG